MKQHFLNFHLFGVPERFVAEPEVSGQGKRGILVVWTSTPAEAADKDFLYNILKAAKIDPQQDAFLLERAAERSISFAGLLQNTEIKYLLVFGITPERLGINFLINKYQPIHYNDCTYLFADSLANIQQERQAGDGTKAAKLWRCLQAVFL